MAEHRKLTKKNNYKPKTAKMNEFLNSRIMKKF